MELFNKHLVGFPIMPPGNAAPKLKLAHEVAACIIWTMNRNDPSECRKACFSIRHHGDKVKNCTVYVVEGMLGDVHYKSGSKVVEAVFEEISKVSKIDAVSVQACPMTCVGRFAPDN